MLEFIFFPKDEIQFTISKRRAVLHVVPCHSWTDSDRTVKAAAARGGPGELHKRFYKWVILTSLNAAICTATDSN